MEASATLTIPRMFSDAAGECRFDQTDISLVMKEYAPPAAPVAVSAPIPTGQCVFMRIPPGFVGDQHPSPQKQLVFLTHTDRAGSLSSLAIIEAADAVQTNGFGSALCSAR